MIAQLRSELLKLRTTRTVGALLLAAAAVTLLGTLTEGLSRTVQELATAHGQRTVFSASGSSVVLFSTLAGLISVTSEFRYGTIRPTLLLQPRRELLLAAKLVAAALTGILFASVSVVLCMGGGLVVLAARNVHTGLASAHIIGLVLGPIAASALGGLLGVAVGALIRNQIGAIVAIAAYALAVDAVMFAAVPSAGRYLPGKASDALAGLPTEHLLAPGVGAAVYAAWALAFVAAAAVRMRRSDI